jgi:hypothetical protein
MNDDFERRLRQQPFRAPPPELCEAIFGQAESPAAVIAPALWTWRDWFWPSPLAWAGLAALWIVFAALSWNERPSTRPIAESNRIPPPDFARATLLSYHTAGSLHHALDPSN